MRSMTGFGKSRVDNEQYMLDVEIRSVNSRYLDLHIKNPSIVNFALHKVNAAVSEKIRRGRVDVFITYRALTSSVRYRLNEEGLSLLRDAFRTSFPGDEIPYAAFLEQEGMILTEPVEVGEEKLLSDLQVCVHDALEQLCVMREAEGIRLSMDLSEKLDRLERLTEDIKNRAPAYIRESHERMRKKVQELLDDIAVNEEMLLNELALFAQKADIDEECVRLDSHIAAFRSIMAKEAVVGKKLDFLIQEMNREVNTISSKSADTELTELCVLGKSLIEQLREQIQNVE